MALIVSVVLAMLTGGCFRTTPTSTGVLDRSLDPDLWTVETVQVECWGGRDDRAGASLFGAVNGNRKPRICGNRKLHTSGEDVSGGADILPVMPVGRFGLDAGSGATGVLAKTRREAAEPAVTLRLPHAVRPTLSSASADAPASGSCCPGC